MKILVGYDGSEAADAAADLACIHAKDFSADVIMITSVEGGKASYGINMEEAEKKLAIAGKRLMENGISVDTQLLSRGFGPGEDIIKFSMEENVDLIYIGVKKRSKMDKILFGSNAQFIILNAPCPVMTVKQK
ncbi:universal stress protein [Desulfosarcina ovata subsp. sediminis]|uniref:Universal stress protein n=1 Tax=Desulfosarcina ovata subsp. sediminis TaxID=885957 RepID=A0A5K7ZLK3_9BACT|nr:universal stress protein [Desulfosarcina ovata]BBO81175.1 universal stress protein [Desulfosarcina ovata subsp. sediminis]